MGRRCDPRPISRPRQPHLCPPRATCPHFAPSPTALPHTQDDRLDYAIAKHILAVHRNKEEAQAAMVRPDYTTSELRATSNTRGRSWRKSCGDEAARQLGARWDAPRTPRTASARPAPPPPRPLLLTCARSLPPLTVRFYRELRQADALARPTRPRTASPSAAGMIRLGESTPDASRTPARGARATRLNPLGCMRARARACGGGDPAAPRPGSGRRLDREWSIAAPHPQGSPRIPPATSGSGC